MSNKDLIWWLKDIIEWIEKRGVHKHGADVKNMTDVLKTMIRRLDQKYDDLDEIGDEIAADVESAVHDAIFQMKLRRERA